MTIYLLDVNVMLALVDQNHLNHDAAHHWFGKVGKKAWATCPLTENGFVRIGANPKYPNSPGNVQTMLTVLKQMCDTQGHHFWEDTLSIRSLIRKGAVVSHKQLTDLYLLGLCQHYEGKLATFDTKIPTNILTNSKANLEIISP